LPLAAYEEEILGYNFIEYGELGRPRLLVLGMPDAGLVGPIASGHLVRSLWASRATATSRQQP